MYMFSIGMYSYIWISPTIRLTQLITPSHTRKKPMFHRYVISNKRSLKTISWKDLVDLYGRLAMWTWSLFHHGCVIEPGFASTYHHVSLGSCRLAAYLLTTYFRWGNRVNCSHYIKIHSYCSRCKKHFATLYVITSGLLTVLCLASHQIKEAAHLLVKPETKSGITDDKIFRHQVISLMFYTMVYGN